MLKNVKNTHTILLSHLGEDAAVLAQMERETNASEAKLAQKNQKRDSSAEQDAHSDDAQF